MNLFDIATKEKDLKELEAKTLEENFWSDSKNSSNVLSKIKSIKSKINEFRKIEAEEINLEELTELVEIEQDEEIEKDIIKSTNNLQKEIEKFEITTFLSGKYDANNAIVTIHPGARWYRITRLGRDVI